MSNFKEEIEKQVDELQKYLKSLSSQKRKVALTFMIANLLIENYDLTKAVGLLERIKHMMLTTPVKKGNREQFFYIT